MNIHSFTTIKSYPFCIKKNIESQSELPNYLLSKFTNIFSTKHIKKISLTNHNLAQFLENPTEDVYDFFKEVDKDPPFDYIIEPQKTDLSSIYYTWRKCTFLRKELRFAYFSVRADVRDITIVKFSDEEGNEHVVDIPAELIVFISTTKPNLVILTTYIGFRKENIKNLTNKKIDKLIASIIKGTDVYIETADSTIYNYMALNNLSANAWLKISANKQKKLNDIIVI